MGEPNNIPGYCGLAQESYRRPLFSEFVDQLQPYTLSDIEVGVSG